CGGLREARYVDEKPPEPRPRRKGRHHRRDSDLARRGEGFGIERMHDANCDRSTDEPATHDPRPSDTAIGTDVEWSCKRNQCPKIDRVIDRGLPHTHTDLQTRFPARSIGRPHIKRRTQRAEHLKRARVGVACLYPDELLTRERADRVDDRGFLTAPTDRIPKRSMVLRRRSRLDVQVPRPIYLMNPHDQNLMITGPGA